MGIIVLAYLAVEILMSLVAFCLYGKDKKMAGNGTEVRIKEKTLLGLAAFGGAPGAFVGRIVFHHKTNKIYFSFVIYASLLLQVAAAIGIILVTGGII
ncbi:MAG: DUF1294 domain-containing protein [Clostridia bacterium]|nr:DUF1294 domain-containing protein [Clostridia bacterium]